MALFSTGTQPFGPGGHPGGFGGGIGGAMGGGLGGGVQQSRSSRDIEMDWSVDGIMLPSTIVDKVKT